MSDKPQHREPTAWLPVARNIAWFACLDAEGQVVCRHRCSWRMLGHKKNLTTGAVLKNGAVIQVSMRTSRASNGEFANLPYANRAEDYEAVLACDKSSGGKGR